MAYAAFCGQAAGGGSSARSRPIAPRSASRHRVAHRMVLQHAFLRDDQRRLRVLEHEALPVGGIAGIDRYIGGTRLEDTQHRDDHLDRPPHADGDELLRPRPEPAQAMRELVGPCIELPIAELASLELHCDRVGSPLDLLLEQLVNAAVFGTTPPGFVPPGGPPLSPGLAGHRQFRDVHSGILDNASEQGKKVRSHPIDRGRVEEVRVELHVPRQPVLGLRHGQRQVELRRPVSISIGLDARPAAAERRPFMRPGGRTAPGTAATGSGRAPAAAPRRASRTARPGARRRPGPFPSSAAAVRTKLGSPDRSPRNTSVLTKSRSTPRSRAAIRPAIGDPDRDVVLSRVAVQQHLEGREQRHEQRRALLTTEPCAARSDNRRGNAKLAFHAPEALAQRARTVRWAAAARATRAAAPASRRAAPPVSRPASHSRCQTA